MTQANNKIITLAKQAIVAGVNARVARYELGVELLATFFTNEGTEKNPIWISNKASDKTATTVAEFAKATYKKVGKPNAKAMEVFYGEAIKFAKKHNTVESAMKEPIKGKKVKESKRFSAVSTAESAIARLGETNAVKMAKKILELAGE